MAKRERRSASLSNFLFLSFTFALKRGHRRNFRAGINSSESIMTKLFLMAFAASTFATSALASGTVVTKIISTTKGSDPFTVYEVSGGSVIHAKPVFFQNYKNYPTVTIPWTDNDGYWYAQTKFTVPAGATKVTLAIASLFADDRVVIELNGKIIGSTGIGAPGAGQMVLTDGGANNPYSFTTANAAKINHVTTGFVTGDNYLKLIVNNTDNGISGGLDPNSGTEVGLTSRLIYTVPSTSAEAMPLTKNLR